MIRQFELPNGFPLTQYALPNGLSLYVVENHSAPVFTYETWFKVGSKDEKLDPNLQATGLAHLFEHMMFRGTQKLPDGQFDEVLARNGVDDENATTWLDRTNYYQSLPQDKLELVIDLESDRMVNLKIDSTLLETEKGAVLGEYRMGLDDPDMVSYDQLYSAAYLVHPYRYTTIGTEDEIKGFTVENANYFYKKYYSPSNATIIVVGDVVPAQVYDLVQKYYGDLPAAQVDFHSAPAEPEPTQERSSVFSHPQLSQPRALFAYPVVPVTHPDFSALWMVMSALTYGQGAVLEQDWVNSEIAISAYGDLNQFKDPGLFILMADLQQADDSDSASAFKDVMRAQSALDKALEKIASSQFSSVAIERARSQLLVSIYQQCEDNGSLASLMGEYVASAGDPTFIFGLLENVKKVKHADLTRVIQAYLKPSRRVRVIGSPSEKPLAEPNEKTNEKNDEMKGESS